MENCCGNDRVLNEYDFVTVGSGFTALAFIDEILRLCPGSRVLCIEGGNDNSAAHYQGLLQDSRVRYGHLNAVPDVFPGQCPWHVSAATSSSEELDACAGTCLLLGGRSNYWYGWCMQPSLEQLRGYPAQLIEATKNSSFWRRAFELLRVTSVDQLGGIFFDNLQHIVERRLGDNMSHMPTVTDTRPAYFANANETGIGLARYSVADQLSKIASISSRPLDILLSHSITRLACSNGANCVDTICTDKGHLTLSNPETKVILCAGAIPNTTILLNSSPLVHASVGQHISGHFRSHVFAKLPGSAFSNEDRYFDERKEWGLAARVICGRDQETGRQYHIQLSAFYCPHYEGRYSEIVSRPPRYGTVPVEAHLEGLEHDIVISCATLGELSEDNSDSWLRLNTSTDMSSNVDLQFALNEEDRKLWDLMDTATFQTIEALAMSSQNFDYWDADRQNWTKQRPSKARRRSSMLVHEASLTPVGDAQNPRTLDESFKVRGYDNVFVTGSSILPTAGSWNPTLAICGFAQELARALSKDRKSVRRDHVP